MDSPGYTQEQRQEAHEQLKRYLVSEDELNRFPRIKALLLEEVLQVTLLNGLYYWNFDLENSLDSFLDILFTEGIQGLRDYVDDYLPIPGSLRNTDTDDEGDILAFWELIESKGYGDEHGVGSGNFGAPFELFKRVYNLQAAVAGVPDMEDAVSLLDEQPGRYQGLFLTTYSVLAGEMEDEDTSEEDNVEDDE